MATKLNINSEKQNFKQLSEMEDGVWFIFNEKVYVKNAVADFIAFSIDGKSILNDSFGDENVKVIEEVSITFGY